MAKRRHGCKVFAQLPSLLELLKKDQRRVLRVLAEHGVCFDPVTYITLTAPLEKVAAYHAVPNSRAFIAALLRQGRRRR